jgi:hypothetical protein
MAPEWMVREDIQRVLEVLVNFHDRSLITASVAVVWC